MKRLHKKIRIKKRKNRFVLNEGWARSQIDRFMARAYDALSESVKQRVAFAKMNREQKTERRLSGYNPYK